MKKKMLRLSNDETKKIMFLQQITGVAIRDFVENEEQIAIVISEGSISRAIGRDGRNINNLERILKKSISFIEYSEDMKRFVENLFFPTKVDMKAEDNKVVLNIDSKNKKFIIGKGGNKIRLARQLLDRHFGIENIKINENPRSLM